jgi:predicted phage terminase large subunit-like protein
MNVPPGMMKSLLTGVFWPAFEWGPFNKPSSRFIGYSYDNGLSTRDALRCRRLMQSNWYQELWGDQFRFVDDQNTKTRYENDATGFRISDYVGGGTGERADRNIIDDPHNVKDGESELKRAAALLWLGETLPTRMNDPQKSAIVCIMQRIHALDISGEIISKELGYEHVMLPMEFEADRRCTTGIGWVDPRKDDGELLFPDRFPADVVERDKKAMGSYAVAGQFQQRPAPRGGGMFKDYWWKIVGAAPEDCQWVRHWDLAATEGAGAFTAGVLIGRSKTTRMFYVKDVVHVQYSGDKVKRLIKVTAEQDRLTLGKRYAISLPQDPGQAGKVQAQDFIQLLAGFDVHANIESGEKETRARPYAAQVEAGNVCLVEGKWIPGYIAEASEFPTGAFKDQIDASSGAFGYLTMNPLRAATVGRVQGLN